MKRSLVYKIEPQHHALKAWIFLKRQGFSSHVLKVLRQNPGSLRINGQNARNIQPLAAGDLLSIELADQIGSPIMPQEMPLSIIYEDADILVLNKPPGLEIHPANRGKSKSLAAGVCAYYGAQGEIFVFRPAHRLDTDTSGLMVIAKNLISAGILFTLLKERAVKKTYLAAVKGKAPAHGRILAPIGRGEGLRRQIDFTHGAYAETLFTRLYHHEDSSLLEVMPITGRTHQIRVHLAHIGLPLWGDAWYGCPGKIQRQALHSHRLELIHPISKKPLSFCCPMPEDMAAVFSPANIGMSSIVQ